MDMSQLPPGLAGYVAAQQQGQQQTAQGLQMASLIEQLQARQQANAQQQAYRQEMGALGPNPSEDQLTAVATKYGGPDAVMKSLDRRATVAASKEAQQAKLDQQAELANAKLEQQTRYADMMLEFRKSQAKTAEEKALADAAHKAQVLDFQKQNAATMVELKKMGFQAQADKVAAGAQNQLQKQTQQLGTALERAGLNEADTVLRSVEDAIKKRPDLPGYLTGLKYYAPDKMVDDDIATGRQAVNKLFNITLKNRSGAAVTNQELERLKNEFATGVWKTAKQFNNGVEQARKIISDHYRGIASGFGKETLDAYNANLREIGGTPLLEGGKGKEDPLGIR